MPQTHCICPHVQGAAAVAYNIDGAHLAAALTFALEAGPVRSTRRLQRAPGEETDLGDAIPTPMSAVEVAEPVENHAVRDVLEEGPNVGAMGL